jgi:mono/diheme cytochrome c family protein
MTPDKKRIITRGIEEEPSVGSGEIPVLFFAVLAGLIFLGLLYLDRYAGGFDNRVYRPYASYDALRDAQPKTAGGDVVIKGGRVYDATCKLCHQPNGLGTPGQFPPLDGSECVNGAIPRLVRIPVHGLAGPIKIKGENWNAAMPAMGAALSDEDLAALLTFVRQAWSNKAGPVTIDQVKKARAATADRTEPWSEADLLAVPETE